jgi:hypothetical protein
MKETIYAAIAVATGVAGACSYTFSPLAFELFLVVGATSVAVAGAVEVIHNPTSDLTLIGKAINWMFFGIRNNEGGLTPPKDILPSPEAKFFMQQKDEALRQPYIIMLAERGEPVVVEGLQGYRVIEGLPEPKTFFPSKDARMRVEALKSTWVEKLGTRENITQVIRNI